MSRSFSLLKSSLQRTLSVSTFVLKKDIYHISSNVKTITPFNFQTRCYSFLSTRMSKKTPTNITTRTSPQSQQTAKMGTTGSSSKTPPRNSSERKPTTRHSLQEALKEEVEEEREKSLKATSEEKRKHYKCGKKYNLLSDVPTWNETACRAESSATSPKKKKSSGTKGAAAAESYEAKKELNDKVSVWKGDITTLEIHAIVNAANDSLQGGGGVDGAIHSAAGDWLKKECAAIHPRGCRTGDAKITAGYKLPAKYVIHTVGPIGQGEKDLRNCYTTSLNLMKEHGLTSIAFPCISTGIYGYPNDKAANLAMKTVREWLENDEYGEKVERVIFCLFLPVDVKLYDEGMRRYFPLVADKPKDNGANGDSKSETEPTKEKEDVKETKMEVDTADQEKEEDKQNKKKCENDVEMVDKEHAKGVKSEEKDKAKGDNPEETKGDDSDSSKKSKSEEKLENQQKEKKDSDTEKDKSVKAAKEEKDKTSKANL